MDKFTKSEIAKIFKIDEAALDGQFTVHEYVTKREKEFVDKVVNPWLIKMKESINMSKLEKKILKIIANHSMYSYDEIKHGYKITKSFDILIEATESAPKLNISLEMAIMSSSVSKSS